MEPDIFKDYIITSQEVEDNTEEYITEKYRDIYSIQFLLASFNIFKENFNQHYGSIEEDGNLISIHTGGWSDNEVLLEEFKKTPFWRNYFYIHQTGGHYFLKTSKPPGKTWKIVKVDG